MEKQMIASMTGFARAERALPEGRLTWELRTVNHRYLEMTPRLPEEWRALEPAVREVLAAGVRRGKLEAQLRFTRDPGQGQNLTLNSTLMDGLARLCAQLSTEFPAPVSVIEILRWPGVVQESPLDLEALGQEALALLKETMAALTLARRREGERLAIGLRERAVGIAHWVAQVRARLPEVRGAAREKLLARLAELDVENEPGRLEQELLFLAQRMDVAEELDRLDSHLVEWAATLARAEPIGRRLDFLLQEFNREANTLGSKSQDTEITRAAIEIKVLIEQMREQIQNVE
ncbi:MAG: YicC/YloC family endoribonuclease [Candidatus Macondimonas sp.]